MMPSPLMMKMIYRFNSRKVVFYTLKKSIS